MNKAAKEAIKKWEVYNPSPTGYKVPEPPRGEYIRLYTQIPSPNKFVVIDTEGNEAPKDYAWRSLPTVLNVELNYWEKTPLTQEYLARVKNTHIYYLIHPDQLNLFLWMGNLDFTTSPYVYVEDTYNLEKLAACRTRARQVYQDNEQEYKNILITNLSIPNKQSMKVCNKCKENRPYNVYKPHHMAKDGLRKTCNICLGE